MSDCSSPVILSQTKDSPVSNRGPFKFLVLLRTTGSNLLVVPARGLSGLIWLYQKALSPTLAALNPACGCRFAPTCSHYARKALVEHGLVFGLFLTLRRLAKCGPWHPGGEDAVPLRRRPVCSKVSSA